MNFEEELTALEEQGLRRFLFNRDAAAWVNLSSNDYLGLSNHPEVVRAAAEALKKWGTGGTSSRLLAGTLSLHEELEENLAAFFRKEAALVFSSGYHTNTGVLPVLAGPGDIVFVDHLCHASILDGIKLSGARLSSFAHNDAADLENALARQRKSYRRAVVVTEGVFSMDGDVPPLKNILDLARRWDAMTYLDEAHGVGVMGPEGRGVAAALGVLGQVDVFVGTLSKSLGSHGGFVACARPLRDLLISRSRAFLYTTALPPASAAAAQAALVLLPKMEDRRRLILEAADQLRQHLAAAGFSTLQSASQIVPAWAGDVPSTQRLSEHLLSHGFFVPSIRPPTVPKGEGRVRLSISFHAAQEGIERLSAAFTAYAEKTFVQTR